MAFVTRLLTWTIHSLADKFDFGIVVLVLAVIYAFKAVRKSLSLPPGPIGYPVVGIIPLIRKEFHLLLFDYALKFGKIFSLRMGNETVVVLSDINIIKKAFQTRDFIARPKTELSQLLGGYGIVNSEGLLWKNQRRYLLNQKLGMRHWHSSLNKNKNKNNNNNDDDDNNNNNNNNNKSLDDDDIIIINNNNNNNIIFKADDDDDDDNNNIILTENIRSIETKNKESNKSGPGHIESVVAREVLFFLKTLESEHNDSAVNPASLLNCAISNVICSILMSRRFRYRDPQFQRFMFLFDEGFRLFTMTGAMTFLPFLKIIPGIANACRDLRRNRDEMILFVREIIRQHREELDIDNPRDLIDAYLVDFFKSKKTNVDKHNLNYEFFDGYDSELQLEQIVLDLFSASVETLRTSLLWAIVFMLHNRDVLDKVRAEIKTIVGPDTLPSVDDMYRLPYTRATMYEIMRRSSVVPMGTTHSIERDIRFEGYTIPKNSHVIPLLHAVHMNPQNWKNPEEFRPERFLNASGDVHKPEHFMPFGVGQRKCLGDNLAEKEFFLFFASLIHVFDLNAVGETLPSLKGVAGVTVTPVDFQVHVKLRNKTALRNSARSGKIISAKLSEDRIYG